MLSNNLTRCDGWFTFNFTVKRCVLIIQVREYNFILSQLFWERPYFMKLVRKNLYNQKQFSLTKLR